jgi:non-homologous end joining protein Ku
VKLTTRKRGHQAKKLTVVQRGTAAPVVDMMTALKQSLRKTAERGKEPKKTLLRAVPVRGRKRKEGQLSDRHE